MMMMMAMTMEVGEYRISQLRLSSYPLREVEKMNREQWIARGAPVVLEEKHTPV